MSRALTPSSGADTEWLTIRMSPDEGRALLRLRAMRELQTGEKVSIRSNLLPSIITEAGQKLRRGELVLPPTRKVPAVSRGGEGERISYRKSEAESAILARISKRLKLEYGQADLVRELIALEAAQLEKKQ